MQIASGQTDPFAGVAQPRLDQVMRGIKRVEAEKGGDKTQCLPISPLILTKMKEVSSPCKDEYNTKMIWAASYFFTFLRAGELTVPSNKDCDPSVHLSVQDIATDDSKHLSVLRLTVKQPKMDPFCKGVELVVGKTGSSLC